MSSSSRAEDEDPSTSTRADGPVLPGRVAPVDRFEVSPADAQLDDLSDPTLHRYRWQNSDVDAVLLQHGVADARLLLRTAAALDDGDRYLQSSELERAADELVGRAMRGYRWSPRALAEIMRRTGLASETALLAGARRLDDGDRTLSRDELEAAAAVAANTVPANDVASIHARIEQLRGQPGVEVEEIGRVQGEPLHALHIPPRDGSAPPKLRVLITAGIHGNEPCGPAAALLLIDQILGHSSFRDSIDFTFIPLINPRGLAIDTRRTPEDDDANRDFGQPDASRETKLVEAYLQGRSFDLALDLHSGKAKRNGFWILHAGREDIMKRAMARFDDHWPALHGDTRPYDMAQPGVGMSSNPSTLKGFVKALGALWSATIEAPGSVSYLDQVFGENELANLIIAEALRQRVLESTLVSASGDPLGGPA